MTSKCNIVSDYNNDSNEDSSGSNDSFESLDSSDYKKKYTTFLEKRKSYNSNEKVTQDYICKICNKSCKMDTGEKGPQIWNYNNAINTDYELCKKIEANLKYKPKCKNAIDTKVKNTINMKAKNKKICDYFNCIKLF